MTTPPPLSEKSLAGKRRTLDRLCTLIARANVDRTTATTADREFWERRYAALCEQLRDAGDAVDGMIEAAETRIRLGEPTAAKTRRAR